MNTEKTNTLGSASQSPTRRPLEEALDDLAGAIDRADNSLDQLCDRLDPLIVRESTAEGKPIILAPSDRSAIVCNINSQILKIQKLVARINELHRNLDV